MPSFSITLNVVLPAKDREHAVRQLESLVALVSPAYGADVFTLDIAPVDASDRPEQTLIKDPRFQPEPVSE